MRRALACGLFVTSFLSSFAACTYLERPLYSSLPLSSALAYGVFRVMGNKNKHIRGRQRIPYLVARSRAKRLLRNQDQGFGWGGITLPTRAKSKGFFFLGEMGSGKTLSLYLLMYEVFGNNPKTKGVIHDVKMNIAPFLEHIGVAPARIKILNPYDVRSVGWDIQKDCVDSGTAFDIAASLVPNVDPKAEYFDSGARVLICYVMRFFIYESRQRKKENEQRKAEGLKAKPEYRWTFRDVIEALRNTEDMRVMFHRHSQLSDGLDYIDNENADITRTVKNPILLLQEIAALWDAAEREGRQPISFREWRDQGEGQILILGFDEQRATGLSAINRVLVHRGMKAVLGNVGAEAAFILDEIHAMGRIPEFERFVPLVREYKVTVAAATQNIQQLRKIYTPELADVILQDLASKVFLKCSGESAKLASQYIDEAEMVIESESETISYQQGRTDGTQEKDGMKRLVITTEFSKLPMFEEKDELHAFYLTSFLGDVYYHKLTRRDLAHIWMEGGNRRDYRQIAEEDERKELRPWGDDDRKRLGLIREEEEAIPEAQPEEAPSIEEPRPSEQPSAEEEKKTRRVWEPKTGRR